MWSSSVVVREIPLKTEVLGTELEGAYGGGSIWLSVRRRGAEDRGVQVIVAAGPLHRPVLHMVHRP